MELVIFSVLRFLAFSLKLFFYLSQKWGLKGDLVSRRMGLHLQVDVGEEQDAVLGLALRKSSTPVGRARDPARVRCRLQPGWPVRVVYQVSRLSGG